MKRLVSASMGSCYPQEFEVPTFVTLSAEAEGRLEVLSTQTGRAKADLLSELIERGLEDIEDYYAAAAVSERIKRGEESVLTDEEFWRGLDA